MNANDPAFPTPCGHAEIEDYQAGVGNFKSTVEICRVGLTKRELFAAMAMHAIISNPSFLREISGSRSAAKYAQVYADALIAELSKTESK